MVRQATRALGATLASALILSGVIGCERRVLGESKIDQLYLELEQKHKRRFDIDGFSLEYLVEPDGKSMRIRLRYPQGSPKERLARDVHAKAGEYVRDLAAGKYGIADLPVRLETVVDPRR